VARENDLKEFEILKQKNETELKSKQKTLNETIQNLNGINNKLIQVSIEAESLAMQLEAADLSLEQRQQKNWRIKHKDDSSNK